LVAADAPGCLRFIVALMEMSTFFRNQSFLIVGDISVREVKQLYSWRTGCIANCFPAPSLSHRPSPQQPLPSTSKTLVISTMNPSAVASAATAPSKAAMMFMRASHKVQQDKGKDLSASIESIKAELAGIGLRDLVHNILGFGLIYDGEIWCNVAVTFVRVPDERKLSKQLQEQLRDATLELHQRALDFELGARGAAEQIAQQERAELAALRACNGDLLAEVRRQQKELGAKDFLLAAQKAAAAAAAEKSASTVRDLKDQVLVWEFRV
jgi:hypothetical protein